MIEAIGIFLFIAGFIIGLGAVTVIDLHGFLGRKSSYWTEATIRTHKVTKPMIWVGIGLVFLGGLLLYRNEPFIGVPLFHAILLALLVLNGLFLSFRVSPFMLERERQGKSSELLPTIWQRKIAMSLVISVLGWWGGLILFVQYLVSKM